MKSDNSTCGLLHTRGHWMRENSLENGKLFRIPVTPMPPSLSGHPGSVLGSVPMGHVTPLSLQYYRKDR